MPRRLLSLAIALLTCASCLSSPLTAASPSSIPSSFAPPSVSAVPAPSATTFVVPKPTEEPKTETGLANASYTQPDLDAEMNAVFRLIYKARTLPRGGQFDVPALAGLVAGPYADYTLPLFDREVRDAQAGVLQEVSFTDIAVTNIFWIRRQDQYAGTAQATATRTRVESRAGASPTRDAATYQFRAERRAFGSAGVRWVVVDFLNPATLRWISEEQIVGDAQVATELKAFFPEFYAARSFAPGRPLELRRSAALAIGTYYGYTMPLLEQTLAEAQSGVLTEIRYADVSVRLVSWDPKATEHGGLATAEVTRTAFVTRSSGAEPAQTATYQFRIHRHIDAATPSWFAVDFFRPDVNRWVTDLAGATVIVPPAGHG